MTINNKNEKKFCASLFPHWFQKYALPFLGFTVFNKETKLCWFHLEPLKKKVLLGDWEMERWKIKSILFVAGIFRSCSMLCDSSFQ